MNTHDDLPISSATVPADAFGLEPLLDVTELAAYLGVPVSTLYDWRTRGKGPAAYRFGMGRPRLSIGSFGDLTTRTLRSGRFEARARYRDWDGRSRIVQATAETATAAERALKKKLAGRSELQPASSSGHLTPDSPFGDLVAYWLQDIDLEGRISRTTRILYERNMRTLVLPVFEHLTLREIRVAGCDRFEQARIS